MAEAVEAAGPQEPFPKLDLGEEAAAVGAVVVAVVEAAAVAASALTQDHFAL